MLDISVLKEKINTAQMLLVGIGEEFDGKSFLQHVPRYLQMEDELRENEQYMWILPYVQNYFLKKEDKLMRAIRNLKALLEGKNYFVVTTCMNGLLDDAGLKAERLVAPCGGFRKLQCCSQECDYLCETPKILYEQIEQYAAGDRKLSQIEIPACPVCGATLQFNSLYAEHYKEKGYLDKWQTYTKWLQGTLNRPLCILELGVSLNYPSVIRFSFEKIAFFNRKAEFIRVHEKLYQLSEELGGKGISQAENAVDFLNHI